MPPKPPASLIRYLREGRAVLFCGSGLSAWAKLPTWKELLRGMIEEISRESPDDYERDELDRLVGAGKLLEVADHCREVLGHRYHGTLSNSLRGVTGEIPEPHRIIVRLPFSGIVTTNYDKLLERSFASIGSWPKTPTHLDVDMLGSLLFDGGFFVLKAHGDIDRPESMVLTTRDYQDLIHSNQAFNSIFSAILLTKAILFVGYSLSDPDFRLLLDRQLTVFKGNVPERFALMSGVGKIERDVLWRTARMRVMPYDEGKHEQLLDFLRAMLTDTEIQGEPPASSLGPTPRVPVSAQLADTTVGATTTSGFDFSISMEAQSLKVTTTSPRGVTSFWGELPPWSLLTKLMFDTDDSSKRVRLIGQLLTDLIPPPFLDELRRTPSHKSIKFHLHGDLELIPWEWIIIDNKCLMLRNAVVRVPSSASQMSRGYPLVQLPPRALLIGATEVTGLSRLPGAEAEIREVHDSFVQSGIICTVITGEDATYERFAQACLREKFDIIHFAGHAWVDEEPFLFLAEATKLHSSELRSLLSPRPPAVLFLNSHYTTFMPLGSRGEQLKESAMAGDTTLTSHRGFLDAAATAGVGALIGSFSGSIGDLAAREIALAFYQELLSGVPVAEALHRSLIASASQYSKHGAEPNHLFYTVSGYGEITFPGGLRGK